MANVRRSRPASRRLTAGKTASNVRSERLPRRVLALLAEPLDPALISERSARDGRLLHYYDGWGAEVVGEACYRRMSLIDPATDSPLAVGMYTAAVRVTVRGCPPRCDAGCGFVADDTPEAHEAAYKGAVT